MSQQSVKICSVCSQPMEHLVKFDIYLCYTCAANAEKEMFHAQFIEINSQPMVRSRRSGYIYHSETEDDDDDEVEDEDKFIIPAMKRSTAIDNCKDDYVVLKKDDDLYVSNNADSREIRSSITFEPVPNYRYNETTSRIEKIDPSMEEEDRRRIVLQKNPNAILEEDFKKM